MKEMKNQELTLSIATVGVMQTFFKTITLNTHGQFFGQFADHAVEVISQALELLISGLEEVWTSPGKQPQSTPAVVRVPYDPADGKKQARTWHYATRAKIF